MLNLSLFFDSKCTLLLQFQIVSFLYLEIFNTLKITFVPYPGVGGGHPIMIVFDLWSLCVVVGGMVRFFSDCCQSTASLACPRGQGDSAPTQSQLLINAEFKGFLPTSTPKKSENSSKQQCCAVYQV